MDQFLELIMSHAGARSLQPSQMQFVSPCLRITAVTTHHEWLIKLSGQLLNISDLPTQQHRPESVSRDLLHSWLQRRGLKRYAQLTFVTLLPLWHNLESCVREVLGIIVVFQRFGKVLLGKTTKLWLCIPVLYSCWLQRWVGILWCHARAGLRRRTRHRKNWKRRLSRWPWAALDLVVDRQAETVLPPVGKAKGFLQVNLTLQTSVLNPCQETGKLQPEETEDCKRRKRNCFRHLLRHRRATLNQNSLR